MGDSDFSYRPRILDSIVNRKLRSKGAILIEGPKWCGKTTTAKQVSKSVLSVDDPHSMKENILLSEVSPEALLAGEQPRLLDEWQVAPKLWDDIMTISIITRVKDSLS